MNKKNDYKQDVETIECEEFSIPLDISDILNICKEYNKLGINIQNYIDVMLDCGVEKAINSGSVKKEYLVFIKDFLKSIENNPYFGDAATQCRECIQLINNFQTKEKTKISLLN